MSAARRTFAVGVMMLAGAAVAAVAAQAVTESVHVVVTGGPLAGAYDATTTRGGCSTGANGPGSWGNSFVSNAKAGPKEIGALSLIVPDAKAAAAGTTQFFMQLRFGSILQQNVLYTIETRPTEKNLQGQGTVKVTDGGATGTVTIEGKTKDGIGVTATIDCKSVVRMGR